MWEAGLSTVRETHQEEDYVGKQPGVAEAAYTKGPIPTPLPLLAMSPQAQHIHSQQAQKGR